MSIFKRNYISLWISIKWITNGKLFCKMMICFFFFKISFTTYLWSAWWKDKKITPNVQFQIHLFDSWIRYNWCTEKRFVLIKNILFQRNLTVTIHSTYNCPGIIWGFLYTCTGLYHPYPLLVIVFTKIGVTCET